MPHRAPLLLAVLLATSTCFGQNPYVDDIYGDGVHAYFRGEVFEAQAQFDRAIQYGSRDPRAFYFRALLHLQNGDCYQAEQDIRTAVTYELQGRGTYDVGQSLERIQGPQRLELERMRLLARLEISANRQSLPYESGTTTPRKLRRGGTPMIPESPFSLDNEPPADASDLDLDQPRTHAEPAAPEAEMPEITESPENKPDPFADDQVQPQGQPADDGQPTAEPPADDPFGSDDPFATGEEDPF